MKNTTNRTHQFLLTLLTILIFAAAVGAQTTAFNYQGKLNDAGVPASGSYQLQFKLYDAAAGGGQIGATVADVPVTATQGVFSVRLDFGEEVFTGANRFLEIAVRHNSSESYTVLAPREQIASTPYSIRTLSAARADLALNSNQLGGIDASEYLTTSTVGNSFIKNDTVLQTANFNISGNGFAGGMLRANQITAQTGTGFYGLTQTDGTTTIGTYVGSSSSGAFGGWLGTQSNSPLFFFTNNSQPQTTLLPNGNFGIGTPSPVVKLDVNGDTVIRTSGSGGNIQFGTPDTETGLSIVGTNRADVRFDGLTLKLLAGAGAGIPSDTSGINITRTGLIGIGTTTPNTRLTLNGGTSWTSNGWIASMNLQNGSAIGWEANASGQRFGIGQSTGALYFFRTSSAFGSTVSGATIDMGITDDGNILQARNKGGLVKAMIVVNPNGTIARCFNSVTNSSSGGCGFGVTHIVAGDYTVNFNFQIDDRFVVGNAFDNPATGCLGSLLYPYPPAGSSIRVMTVCGTYEDAPFTLIVY